MKGAEHQRAKKARMGANGGEWVRMGFSAGLGRSKVGGNEGQGCISGGKLLAYLPNRGDRQIWLITSSQRMKHHTRQSLFSLPGSAIAMSLGTSCSGDFGSSKVAEASATLR
jgi:hypothetical protein